MSAEGPSAILAALGVSAGPSREAAPVQSARSASPPPGRVPFRGRCGNRSHPEIASGRGADRVVISESSEGCDGEVADGPNPLRLCARCLEKYRGAMPVPREHVAALGVRDPMPGLCFHGQRNGVCGGICFA